MALSPGQDLFSLSKKNSVAQSVFRARMLLGFCQYMRETRLDVVKVATHTKRIYISVLSRGERVRGK